MFQAFLDQLSHRMCDFQGLVSRTEAVRCLCVCVVFAKVVVDRLREPLEEHWHDGDGAVLLHKVGLQHLREHGQACVVRLALPQCLSPFREDARHRVQGTVRQSS